MKNIIILLFSIGSFAQVPNTMTYNEFLGYVKKYHPLVKSANLEVSMAQANLMIARGAFDPKINVDYDKKQFKDKEYYGILNSSFKIPTWYGIEIKAGFDQNDGIYLDPQNTVPTEGLATLGISIPLAQGLLINQRMADLRKAKIQIQLSQSERKLEAINILHAASIAYFNWKRNHSEVVLYTNYVKNAEYRFKAIKTLIKQGDKPAIDSVEAGIIVKNRVLNLEDSQLKLAKAKLELANFLWIENNIPLELQDNIIPEDKLENTIQETLKTNQLLQADFQIKNHPKINALQSKIDLLTVDKKLKTNQLLPKIDLGYNYLSDSNYLNQINTANYKIGLNVAFPLFLRKERGSLKLTNFKIQDTQYSLAQERVTLTNKINAQNTEIKSLQKQNDLISNLVNDYTTMLNSEEKLFTFGESSIFLINTRENNLISSQLAQIQTQNRFYNSHADLFKTLVNIE